MTYSGESISKENIPDNWKTQCSNILDVLDSKNCSHNDIKPEDILVHEGKLKLIDFGWASKIGDDIPSNWPTCIGGNFRHSSEKFDDSYSLFKSMESINE